MFSLGMGSKYCMSFVAFLAQMQLLINHSVLKDRCRKTGTNRCKMAKVHPVHILIAVILRDDNGVLAINLYQLICK